MVVVGVVEPVAGAKEQTRQNKDRRQAKQNNFNVHVLTSLFRLEAKGKTADFEGDFCNVREQLCPPSLLYNPFSRPQEHQCTDFR
jgi:hypothetical protein